MRAPSTWKPLSLLLLLSLTAGGALSLQDAFEPARPTDQHEWLQQLVGEWTVTSKMTMESDGEPMEMTEKVRSIGGLWIQGEGTATFGDTKFTSVLTLGYDARQKAFVGTWIDTMQTHLWVYRGSLDDSKKVLTLEAEGPLMSDPTQTAKYRDAIEIKSPDHRVLTSSIQGEDGEWTTYMRADYHRKK